MKICLLPKVICFKVLWCSNNRPWKSCNMLKERQYLKNKKSTPPTHPTPIFNSKVRCGSSLFYFLKQNNKIFASTISKMLHNAFHSVILYLKKKLSILTKLIMKVLHPCTSQRKLKTETQLLLFHKCFRQSLFPHTSEIKLMNLKQ